jgi:hypothetical protein
VTASKREQRVPLWPKGSLDGCCWAASRLATLTDASGTSRRGACVWSAANGAEWKLPLTVSITPTETASGLIDSMRGVKNQSLRYSKLQVLSADTGLQVDV